MNWGPLSIATEPRVLLVGLAILSLLLAFVLWLTVGRPNRRFRRSRVIASLFAVFSLLAMALQPGWKSDPEPVTAILITPGAEPGHFAAIGDSLQASRVFALRARQQWKSIFPQIEHLPDLAYLQRHFPESAQLHVFGHGATAEEWQEVDSLQIRPHLAPVQPGIRSLFWPREVVFGEAIAVQGMIAGSPEQSLLCLIEFGGVADSVRVPGRETVPFEFTVTPRDTGRFLYSIRLLTHHQETHIEEKFDVHVIKPEPIRVLFLEKAVSFETRQLRNWLIKRRAQVAIRTVLSRERFRYEVHSRPQADLSRVTSGLLREFDLVIIDATTLAGSSDRERRLLRFAVEQEGLGLLIKPDAALFDNEKNYSNRGFFLDFALEEFATIDFRLVRPSWQGFQDTLLPAIPSEPYAIKPTWGVNPLISDEMERTVVAASRHGQGTVGLTLLRESYRWALEGHQSTYAAYWSHLLSSLARHSTGDRWSLFSPIPPIVDQPVRLVVETDLHLPVGLVGAENDRPDSLYLAQDRVRPQQWTGRFWPRREGWHRVATPQGRAFWFYAFEQDDWQTWQQGEKIDATTRYAIQNDRATTTAGGSAATRHHPVPLYYFFIVFLLSCTFLWIERKLPA